MYEEDIRWKQRLDNYKKALSRLDEALAFSKTVTDTEVPKWAVIQAFEFTFELAWNVMKDFLEEQGFKQIIGSKNAIRMAFSQELIPEGKVWMDMVEKRNETSHTYDETVADLVYSAIIHNYYAAFCKFRDKMEGFL